MIEKRFGVFCYTRFKDEFGCRVLYLLQLTELTELIGDRAVPGTRPSLTNLTLTHRCMFVEHLTKMMAEIRE